MTISLVAKTQSEGFAAGMWPNAQIVSKVGKLKESINFAEPLKSKVFRVWQKTIILKTIGGFKWIRSLYQMIL